MLNVSAVPAFNDNYLWLIHDDRHAAVVDPGDGQAVLHSLDARHLSLVAILLTHHHADHVGGVPELLQKFKVPVFGPRDDGIAGITDPLDDGDTITLPQLDVRLSVIAVPGHTRGHIAYFAPNAGWLFCGDTLFAGGCGRLFEGTPQQMMNSLGKLAALPDDTEVYCAHEYTLANLRFAQQTEPGNPALFDRIAAEQAKRARGEPTLPSSIGLEKATNPFLRVNSPEILQTLRQEGRLHDDTPVGAFAALREWKNVYR